MPKTPKKESAPDENPVTTNGTAAATETTAAAPGKKRAKPRKAPTAKKTAAKKKSAPGAAKKTNAKRPPQAAERSEPSDADIRLRAYFIAERRVQLALQGDPAKDWLDARQQLIEEARESS